MHVIDGLYQAAEPKGLSAPFTDLPYPKAARKAHFSHCSMWYFQNRNAFQLPSIGTWRNLGTQSLTEGRTWDFFGCDMEERTEDGRRGRQAGVWGSCPCVRLVPVRQLSKDFRLCSSQSHWKFYQKFWPPLLFYPLASLSTLNLPIISFKCQRYGRHTEI